MKISGKVCVVTGAASGIGRATAERLAVEAMKAGAYDYLTKNCVWSVNTGFSKERTEWSIENAIENGDLPADKRPSYDQVVEIKLGEEALKTVGGPTKIRGCSD